MVPERQETEMRDTDMAPGEQRAQQRHERKRLSGPTVAQRREFAEAHAEGLHVDVAREFCPRGGRTAGVSELIEQTIAVEELRRGDRFEFDGRWGTVVSVGSLGSCHRRVALGRGGVVERWLDLGRDTLVRVERQVIV